MSSKTARRAAAKPAPRSWWSERFEFGIKEFGLFVLEGGFLVLALIAAFWLGRWAHEYPVSSPMGWVLRAAEIANWALPVGGTGLRSATRLMLLVRELLITTAISAHDTWHALKTGTRRTESPLERHPLTEGDQ